MKFKGIVGYGVTRINVDTPNICHNDFTSNAMIYKNVADAKRIKHVCEVCNPDMQFAVIRVTKIKYEVI